MNPWDILIIAIIVLIATGAFYSLRRRKNGSGVCSCSDCPGCSGCANRDRNRRTGAGSPPCGRK
ncbi:MAG: FeoB-associated Cys-rich membrane protein [Firmicutes bacterium]|nr:FeoB-associated Cys-rich membrane protein [Bacillota bacterium]